MENYWYTLQSSKILFLNLLDAVSHSYTLLCTCRGGSKNEKCLVTIAGLVHLYNAAQEGLYCPVKNDRSAYHLFALCLGTKKCFVQFCYAHEQRLRINLHNFRVIPADAAEGELVVLEYPYSAEFSCLAISGRWRRTSNRNA